MIWTLIQVAFGGAIGSALRYLTVVSIGAPLGTIAVNVLGSFVMGVLFATISARTSIAPFLMTGILGGFTTFSAFSLDTLLLWESGQPVQAAAYVAFSVFLSLAAVAVGVALARGALI